MAPVFEGKPLTREHDTVTEARTWEPDMLSFLVGGFFRDRSK